MSAECRTVSDAFQAAARDPTVRRKSKDPKPHTMMLDTMSTNKDPTIDGSWSGDSHTRIHSISGALAYREVLE